MKCVSAYRHQLAVVICTYNRSSSLIRTLTSLYACGYAGGERIDVLVVANNCSDDTLAKLDAFRASHPQALLRLDWIEEPKAGKSHALNAAIAYSKHDALCFIDDDQIVERNFLANLADGLRRFPDDDIFCGRIWPAWNGSEPAWVHATAPYAIPIRPFPEFDFGPDSVPIDPNHRYPSGGNITVRRRVFDHVGGFSTDLGPTGHNLAGGEDNDFLRRATQRNHRIRYLGSVRQLHAIDNERTSTSYTLKKSFHRSRSSFLTHSPGQRPQLYMLRKVLAHGARAAFTLNADRRFFYLVRLAASLGEFAGALRAAETGKPDMERRQGFGK